MRMTDEEWMTANPGVGSCDAPGTYTGDRIEELEEEIKRLRRIEKAVIPLYKALKYWRNGLADKVTNKDISFIGGADSAIFRLAAAVDVARYPLDNLLGKGETK